MTLPTCRPCRDGRAAAVAAGRIRSAAVVTSRRHIVSTPPLPAKQMGKKGVLGLFIDIKFGRAIFMVLD